MKEPLYLLDGYSLIYRSYFAFISKPLINPAGQNRSAVFGFFRTVITFFQERNPAHFCVVLDSRVPTFRHEKYPEYKATRDKTPQDLHDQVPVVEEICAALGIPIVRKDGFEADDIIATYATRCMKEGRPCRIITGDKDLLQLVEKGVVVLRPDKGGYLELSRDQVYENWGVWPEQMVDYLSLTGDQSDNVPGVRGVGPKTAEKLISRYGTLDAVYAHLDELSPGDRRKLEEGRESAFMSRDLIVLVTDIPGLPGLEDLRIPRLRSEEAAPLFLREGARSLAEQVTAFSLPLKGYRTRGAQPSAAEFDFAAPAAAASNPAPAGKTAAQESAPGAAAVSGPIPAPGAAAAPAGGPVPGYSGPGSYEAVTSLDALSAWIEKVRAAKRFAYDVETDGLDEMTARPVGFSLSVGGNAGCYIPLRAEGREILPEAEVRTHLSRILTDPSLMLVGQNHKYDYKVTKRWGIPVNNLYFDTMIAAWLLDAQGGVYNMDRLAEVFLGYRTIHFDDVVPKGATFDTVPLDVAVRYSAEDADITFRLFEVFEPMLRERGLEKLFREIEIPLVSVLAEMELRGIRLLPGILTEYGAELEKTMRGIEAEIYKLCGREFNIGSTKQLQEILYIERKLPPSPRTKPGYSTDVPVLEELAREDKVPELILRHRTLSKLKSTYVDALPLLINPETGRIHSRFVQTGTATGRLSSRDPNLQNIPIREEEGRRIRTAFVPCEGSVFISADYSQIELVVLAHLSEDPALIEAFMGGADVHRRTASLIFGVPLEEVSPEQRRIAKTINFGVMYGMSSFRLSQELSIPRGDATRFIDSYFSTYRGVRGYMERVIAKAEETGKVSTIFGRERAIPGIASRNKTEKQGAERMAVNTGIQGSAADIVKKAMLAISARIEREGLRSSLLLQVHDELIFEVPLAEEARLTALVREEMERVVSLKVPLRVSVERGESWGAMH